MPRNRLLISRRAQFRTFAWILMLTLVPVLGTIGIVVASIRPNLEDLVPIRSSVDQYLVLNWSELLREPLHPGRQFSGEPVRALGYMVENDRIVHDGDWVQDFVLLPNAGSLLHPAHRFGDQMVAVHLQSDAYVQFSSRALVWAWGRLQSVRGDAAASTSLYHLDQARVQRTEETAIAKYFK